MSRAAVLDALRSNQELLSLVPHENIIGSPMGEGRPSDISPTHFIVLRWGEQTYNSAVGRGPRSLTVWSHTPKEISDSYNFVDEILGVVSDTICSLEHTVGADGWRVTMAWPSGGWSDDMVDPGYNTVCRNAGFMVLSSRV